MALLDNAWYVNFGNGSSTGYYAVTPWAAAALKVCGDLIRQLTAPAVGSERVYVCYNSTSGIGTTAPVTEPTFPTTRGGLVTDNTVKWQEATGIAALNGDVTNTPTWATYRAFTATATLGQVVKSTDGTKILICTVGGAMSALVSEPTWSAFTTTGATTVDTSATWVTIAALPSGFPNWGAPHARIASANANTWGQVGNSWYIASEHAETQASALTIGGPVGTLLNKYICVDKNNVPPGSANVTTGATISTTGANGITDIVTGGVKAYFRGLTLQAGSSSNAASINFGQTSSDAIVWDTCVFTLNNTGASLFTFASGAGSLENNYKWYNCTWNFGSNAAQGIVSDNGTSVRYNRFEIIGGSMAFGATKPTDLFGSATNIAPSNLTVRGCDLSAYTAGTLVAGNVNNSVCTFIDCAIAAGITIQGAYASYAYMAETNLLRVDSAGTDYRHAKYNYFGNQVPETTIVRTGGASDGITGLSIDLTTSANPFPFVTPFICFPLPVWNTSTASTNVTVFGTIKDGLPNNTDLDIEIEYLGSGSNPLGTVVNTNAANILAAAAPVTADNTSAWGAGAAAYQTGHAYGAFTGVILAGNASPQQLWFMSSHAGSGTSGSDSTIFNGQVDGATVTDNSGANQIVWRAMSRFKLTKAVVPGMQGSMYVRIRGFLATMTWYLDPLVVLS